VVVKLLPVRVTGVSKERETCVLWDNVDGRESKSEAESVQSDCASILLGPMTSPAPRP
jgi:hypothetical protein